MNDKQLGEGPALLSASEALYGFAAWLTYRDEPVTLSAKHDAAIIARLVNEFCQANSLNDPRHDFHTRLIHPEGEVAVAGRGKNSIEE